MKKLISLVLICVLICVCLSSCSRLIDSYLFPGNFPGRTYYTKDGSISFTVYQENTSITGSISSNMFGSLTKDGVSYDFFVDNPIPSYSLRFTSLEMQNDASVNELSYIPPKYILFYGYPSYKNSSHFTLEVCEGYEVESPLYEDGTVFEFYATETVAD